MPRRSPKLIYLASGTKIGIAKSNESFYDRHHELHSIVCNTCGGVIITIGLAEHLVSYKHRRAVILKNL